MSGKKRIGSGDDLSDSEGEIGVTPAEKLDSEAGEGASNMSRGRKKRKASTTRLSYSSPTPKIFWSKDDELAILKSIVDYEKEKGMVYSSDPAAFFKYIRNEIESKFSKDQVLRKIRKLKGKFLANLVKQPSFTVAHDSKMFDLSMGIWGKGNGEFGDGNMKGTKIRSRRKVVASVELEDMQESGDELPSENAEIHLEDETGGKESEEGEAVANGGGIPSGDGGIPSDCVDKHVEKDTGGMENGEDGAEDELCVLQDALDAMLFQGLSKSAQKLMLQKLRSIGAMERKALCDEWKALLVEEIRLKIKKQGFIAKLTNVILQG